MRKISIASLLLAVFAISSCTSESGENTAREVSKYTIDQFYNNEQIGGGSWNDSGDKLMVNSNSTGIYNLYEIDIASGEKTALTNSTDESYFGIDYVPGTDDILYSADKGGNEIDHIYLLKPDGTSQDLTPGEQEKTDFYGWTKDRKSMYFVSNKRDARFFDLYKMNIGEWVPELLFQNDEGYDVSSLSADENLLALSKSITTSENKLFLYNRTTKSLAEVSSDEAPGSYSASGFSDDDSTFYYITDVGKEFSYLKEHNLASGDEKTMFETNWDVMYSYTSENEKYRVIGINEDGKNSLIIQDADGKKVNIPTIDGGDIEAVSFSDDESKMRLSVGSSKAPRNIYAYDFASNDMKALTNTLNPEMNADDLVSAEVVRFDSFDGQEIPAIYYKPHQASKDNPVPALVWVHGGPGGQSRQGYFALIQYMVNHGYAILAVNNRGSSGYGKTFYKMDDRNHGDKDLKDCIAGKDWLAEQNYIDADKIGIIGGSYGGYMTMAALAFAPEEFDVGVNIFGVTNWLRTLKSIPPYWESFREALYEELGDPYSADSTRLYEISPLFHAENVTKPLLVLQGANDPRVLQVESDEMVAGVKKNGVPVEYIIFPDEGHGFVKKENEKKGYSQIVEFLDKYLKGEETTPDS